MSGEPDRRAAQEQVPSDGGVESPPAGGGRAHVAAAPSAIRAEGVRGSGAADSGPVLERDELLLRIAYRETWSDAAIETATALLHGTEEDPLSALAARLQAVARADGVVVLRAGAGTEHLTVAVTAGETDGLRPGDPVPLDDRLAGAVLRSGRPRLEHGPPSAVARVGRRGPQMAVPIWSSARIAGVVTLSRRAGGPLFDESDLQFLATFVAHASIALELAEARSDRESAALIDDRARIARDLHDTAIQQLFAAGLELRATATAFASEEAAGRVLHAIGLVDVAIGQIRTAVLALSADPAGESLRRQVIDVVRDLALPFATSPEVVFDGPVDLIGRGGLSEDVVAVVRESLANAAKHAGADHVGIAVRALDGTVEIEVWDDGAGPPADPVRSGLANLADRAEARNGSFDMTDREPGTRIVWRVPAGERDGAR